MALLWLAAILLPWVAGLGLALLPAGIDRLAKALGLLGALATALLVTASLLVDPATGRMDVLAVVSWLPELALEALVVRDGLSALFAMVTAWCGVLITLYSWSYLPHAQDHAGQHRREATYYALLSAFTGAMLGLVASGNLLQFYVFWELTGVFSYLLIGFWYRQPEARWGARLALILTTSGGLMLLFGLVTIGMVSGSWSFPGLLAWRAEGAAGDLAAALVVCGALAKSAQFPFSNWLPAAMTAPTPVSAFLHSSTLVAAGVYLLARFFPLLGGREAWAAMLVVSGIVGSIVPGLLALRQETLKGLLAWSTISQYAFMCLAFGLGSITGAQAALYAFLVHAAIKAGLFLSAGAMTHLTGETRLDRIGGLWQSHPGFALLTGLLALSLGGVPILGGFYYKEELLYAAWEHRSWILFAAMQVGGLLTLLYMLRFLQATLFGPQRSPRIARRLPVLMLVPIALLALVPLYTGLEPDWMSRALLDAAIAATVQRPAPLEVQLKAGAVLLLSLVVLAFGFLVWHLWRKERLPREWVERLPARLVLPGGMLVKLYGGLADRSLALHDGSLRNYLRRVLVASFALMVLFGSQLAWGGGEPIALPPLDLTLVLAISLMAAAATVWLRYHVAAVLALTISGYALAAAFALMHAPDVALAQVLVETLATFSIVIALRQSRLIHPERTRILQAPGTRAWRWLISIGVGVAMALFTDWVTRRGPPYTVGAWYATEGYARSGMHDLVTAILANFRALDTAVEITVFATAALAILGIFYRYPLPRRQVRRE